MKPLFVPLATRWFREFEAGLKSTEYRRYGPRWNESTCQPGRAVTLSHGYSGARITARIKRLRIVKAHTVSDARGIYPPGDLLAAIDLTLDQ